MNSAINYVKNNASALIKICIIALIAIQISFFSYHIFSDFKLVNEFRYIDEETILDNGRIVSNKEYIDTNLLSNDNFSFTNEYNSNNNILLKEEVKSLMYHLPKYIIVNSPSKQTNFWFNYKYRFPAILYDNKFKETTYQENQVKDLRFLPVPLLSANSMEQFKEKIDFISANIFEQNMQILNRYYWHEAPFMLSPINDLDLGRDKSEIFSQYGFLSLYPIKFIMQCLGGINVSNFEKTKSIVCLVYYLTTVAFAFLFFKNNIVRLIFISLLSIKFFSTSYYFYHYGPTQFDTRHFFDLFIVLLLLYSARFENKKFISELLCCILALFSILLSNDFGLYIFLSLLGTFFIDYIANFMKRKRLSLYKGLFILSFLVAGVFVYINYPMMKNPSIKYFLDGFYSFNIPSPLFAFVLFVIFIQWVMLIVFYKKLKDSGYFKSYLFLLFYTEFFCTYMVWRVDLPAVNFYISALPFIIILNLFPKKIKSLLSMGCVIICLLAYAKFSLSYAMDIVAYNKILQTHKTYKWDHERAGGIITTYSFDKFQNSLDLIDKYSGDTKELYMISKYDNILQFFSKKYSGLKYFELRSFLVSKIEYDEVRELINKKADILYVDADIDWDYEAELKKRSFFDLYQEYWYLENVKQRIPKLKTLTKLFNEVKKGYELVEEGELINVYRRK